ncbi:hypothetical protein K8S19_00570 [bacterium]|nr:hypothetical protein [bacterium]
MSGSQINLTFRVRPTFGPEKCIQMVQLLVESMFFDEEAQFDLMIKKNNDERLHDELTPVDLGTFINPQTWPEIHQILFSNQWMKGMNLKFQLVRRHDYISLMLKCEMESPDHQQRLVRRIEEFLLSESYSEGGNDAHDQERERLFGSMLMHADVIRVARQPFLAGRFQEAIAAVVGLLVTRLEALLHARIKQPGDVVTQLSMDPPRLLLPDLSGKKLYEELSGIGNLCSGILTLTKPLVYSKVSVPEDPARILKWLVLIGLLLERLEGASFNPALQGRSPGKTPLLKKTVKKKLFTKQAKKTSGVKKKVVKKKVVKKKAVKKKAVKKKAVKKKAVKKKAVKKKVVKKKVVKKKVSKPITLKKTKAKKKITKK